ncbi:diguanylate cyclase domain-containing protein [Halovibrio sp. HP20-50]|uniref:diguanylate cyclase domain-containing protein n=1 Tax=Halovibrio sp. HP20-59 TaxID=3080275 RepID=UPI00294B7602|nr:diguanylate cyclase [Halovibrio sp. HP20-59]MEA2117232.1 diguanylate cyclase [Halovibrio sp. HP20-59]
MAYPITPDEDARLAILHELELLDTPHEPVFDRVTRLVTKLLNVPIATVSLIDADRQWLKSSIGVETRETSRDVAFCAHTIMQAEPLIVEDATADERFANNPFVTAREGIRFYVGFPLLSSQGLPLGALCAIDTKPRTLQQDELAVMQDLTAIVTDEIHLRERLVFEKKTKQATQQALKAFHESMESQIERRTSELNLVIESAYDAYISLDTQDVVLDWNRAAEMMFGWSRKRALARPITQLMFPQGLPASDEQAPLISTAQRHDGSQLPVEIRIKSLRIDGQQRRSLFIHDITERQQLERLRDQEAREDVLTQLPNRRALNERMTEAMARARRSQKNLAVLFMDLDGFKAINDQHGHATGDTLLREIAKRLKSAVRETDYVARWAGDEFVVLLESVASDAVQPLAQSLVDVTEKPVAMGEINLRVSTSIGVALYSPSAGETAQELLKRADVAMYEAKHLGKAQVSMARPADSTAPDVPSLKDEHD